MADPSTEYAKNMTKNSSIFDPDMQTAQEKKARVKGHKFNQMKGMEKKNPSKRKKGSEGTGSYFGKASKRGRAYMRDLEEAGKI